jgi:hypothetical protein
MLTSNHARSNQKHSEPAESHMDSTNYGAQSRQRLHVPGDDQETQISEIEKKFVKKQKNAY